MGGLSLPGPPPSLSNRNLTFKFHLKSGEGVDSGVLSMVGKKSRSRGVDLESLCLESPACAVVSPPKNDPLSPGVIFLHNKPRPYVCSIVYFANVASGTILQNSSKVKNKGVLFPLQCPSLETFTNKNQTLVPLRISAHSIHFLLSLSSLISSMLKSPTVGRPAGSTPGGAPDPHRGVGALRPQERGGQVPGPGCAPAPEPKEPIRMLTETSPFGNVWLRFRPNGHALFKMRSIILHHHQPRTGGPEFGGHLHP